MYSKIRSFLNTSSLNFINSTKFVWERYEDKIIVDRAFAQSLATELESNHISEGTILFVTEEMLLDPAYVFNYNNKNDVKFPGRYNITIVADRFDSQGGKIDLTGANGSKGIPDPGDRGNDPGQSQGDEHGAPGGPGGPGGLGGPGGEGMNIKIFCDELLNIEIISNGGVGGNGGNGGRGGHGGSPGPAAGNAGKRGGGGKGGRGGKAGDGGKAGQIQVLFCTTPNGFIICDHLTSRGGNTGIEGNGGPPGSGRPPPNVHGGRGLPGIRGADSNPDIKRVELSELWEKVSIELGIPVPEPGEE